ncbi:Testicular acid phosphatase-like protein [Aphelenchoides bicaudatus]|nr:Testicular acid phosphatase-like protein [Aphelenchoides bicaudatus]
MQDKIGHKIFSAFVELFMALGFFLVYLIEELIGEFFTKHSEQKNKQKANNELVEMKRSSSITQYDAVKLNKHPKEHKALVNIYTFILAITFHMFMEGFLFGAQTKVLSLSSLFFGIIVHKVLVLFSIGIKLARQLEDRTRLAVAFIVLAIFCKSFERFGWISSFNNNAPGATFSTIISSLSVGTFTYIALFEILVPERNSPYSKLLQWLSCFVGFALMAGFFDSSITLTDFSHVESNLFSSSSCFFFLTFAADEKKELQFVQAIWRHGDRAPGALPYPNDRYTEDHWPRGWNQLTNEGMRQLKDLGEFFRERYAGSFVNKTYNVKEVYVQSTDKARAIVSAQSLLYGFFPPAAHEKFDNAINWHPIPVHCSGINDEDPLLKPTKFACPAFDKEVVGVQQQFANDLFSKHAEFYEFVRNNTGFREFGLGELKSMSEVPKEVDHGLEQPDWLLKKWSNMEDKTTLDILKEHSLAERLVRLSTKKLAQLRGGYLLGDWLLRALKVQKGKQKKPKKMLLYSSHDGTLQSFLHILDVADGLQIPYAACVFMEIYKDQEGEHTLLFRHGKEVSPLAIKGCGEECTVKQFFKVLEKRSFFSKEELYAACERDDFCESNFQKEDNAAKKKAKKLKKLANRV